MARRRTPKFKSKQASASIGVEGGVELRRQLLRLEDQLSGDELENAAVAGILPIADAMSKKAAVSEGEPTRGDKHLADNIVVADSGESGARGSPTLKDRKFHKQVATGPHKDAYHGIFLEVGTPRMPAKPFMRPAFDEKGPEAVREVARELRRGIRKVARGA